MSGIQIGHLYRKRTVRGLSGNIIDMRDEANGGVIISKGQVVNQERLNELAKIEEDKRKAATAFAEEVAAPAAIVEERVAAPTKLENMEKRIDNIEGNLNKILEILQKK